jgi:putative N6-adenine-specific DNA methylase
VILGQAEPRPPVSSPRTPAPGPRRAPRGRSAELAFAACAPGLEAVLARELAALGLDARAVRGGAEVRGEDAVALSCLGSRVADAVKLRRTGGGSLDAAGAPLFRRGWRARVGAAPLRESLAAGLLLFLGFDGEVPFLDPMCGSGTLAIEAALVAGRRAPGLGRTFAFESWPGHDAGRTAALRARLAAAARVPPRPVLASDRNGGAVRLAARNAAAAGMAAHVRIERREAADVVPPPGPGLCLVNPPYGVRLDTDAGSAWRALGALLPRLAGWTVGVLAPAGDARRLASGLGRPWEAALEVRNGGLRTRLLVCRP